MGFRSIQIQAAFAILHRSSETTLWEEKKVHWVPFFYFENEKSTNHQNIDSTET